MDHVRNIFGNAFRWLLSIIIALVRRVIYLKPSENSSPWCHNVQTEGLLPIRDAAEVLENSISSDQQSGLGTIEDVSKIATLLGNSAIMYLKSSI